MRADADHTFTIFVMGAKQTGKGTLINKFVSKTKTEIPGVRSQDLALCSFEVDKKTVQLRIYKINSQDEYSRYKGYSADAAIIIYDTTNSASFQEAKKFLDATQSSAENKKWFKKLVGTKCDLGGRKVDFNDARDYAHGNNITHCETSAGEKTRKNVNRVFVSIARQIMRQKSATKNRPLVERYNEQKRKRIFRTFLAVLCAIIFSPLSLLISVPHWRKAKRDEQIKKVKATFDERDAVISKIVEEKKELAARKGLAVRQDKPYLGYKDSPTGGTPKLVIYVNNASYSRYAMFAASAQREELRQSIQQKRRFK